MDKNFTINIHHKKNRKIFSPNELITLHQLSYKYPIAYRDFDDKEYSFVEFIEKIKFDYSNEKALKYAGYTMFECRVIITLTNLQFHTLFNENNYSILNKMFTIVLNPNSFNIFKAEDLILQYMSNVYDAELQLNQLHFIIRSEKQN